MGGPQLGEHGPVQAEGALRLGHRRVRLGTAERQPVEALAIGVLERLRLGDPGEGVELQPGAVEPVVPLEHPLDHLAAGEVSEVAGVRVRGVAREVAPDVAQPRGVDLGGRPRDDGVTPAGPVQVREVALDRGDAGQGVEDEGPAAGVEPHPPGRLLERPVDDELLGREVRIGGQVEPTGQQPFDEALRLGLGVLGARALAQPGREGRDVRDQEAWR
ncbi:hypothetical protein GCM10007368_33650 [Isoptericola cucumis]|uniref:Uncharacterized protein n=1 Tax=Isoptericola cucumis TaxID=1776856 RepID=A0ABQ2BBK4_9MICO|nr:hypothetical protein GCM10007368_33650 [Isoptericola cucumis]